MNKYTIKGKCKIIENDNESYVLKNSDDNHIREIYSYLESRDFKYFPKILSFNRGNIKYEYLKDINIYNPHKGEDLITLVGLLHSKTSYKKEVSEETYKEIYEDILNNINYLTEYYNKYYELFLNSIYSSPKEYEFLRNYSKINSALLFSKSELDIWYDLVKNKNSQRISLNHNNLSTNHYIKNKNDYLISWDNAKFDTPVLDLYKLYKNDFWNLEFSSIYKKYININSLSDSEQKLFFILISLPPKIDFEGNEFNICKNMRIKLDYIFKTEEFLKPYYSTNT